MAYLRNEGSTGVQFKEVYQGIERDSMAYKLMSSMGWQEGEGLVRTTSSCDHSRRKRRHAASTSKNAGLTVCTCRVHRNKA